MSKPIYMSIHDMEWHETAQAVKTMPIARKPEPPEPNQIDPDMRRIALSFLAMIKRKSPSDWRRIVAEVDAQRAAA